MGQLSGTQRHAGVNELIQEFIKALAAEIEVLKKGRGGSTITVYEGRFVRREGPFYVYVFSTESPLIVMDDAPVEIDIGGQKHNGQIISVQGSDVAIGLETEFGDSIPCATLVINLWYILEALRKRYEDVLDGKLRLETRLGLRALGLEPTESCADASALNLPPSETELNDEQISAIRNACGSDIHFIWGPPGTGKTQTIGFLIATLLQRDLRVLIASHTNVATDHAIRTVANLTQHTDDFQSGKLVRFGNISPDVQLPDMVKPEKIAERLGAEMTRAIGVARGDLESVQADLSEMRKIERDSAEETNLRKSVEHLSTERHRMHLNLQDLVARASELSAQANSIREKLEEARKSGAVRRLMKGLNVQKLGAKLAQFETTIVTNAAGIEAGRLKVIDFDRRITIAETRLSQITSTILHDLSHLGIGADQLPSRIDHLCTKEEELAGIIRNLEGQLDAIAARILVDAKLVATSLTKATISKQLDGQQFDVLVVDEGSMAPMPALFFAAGRATKKVIVVGDFRQLPPICISDATEAQKWLGRDIFSQAGIQRSVDKKAKDPRMTMLRQQYRMHPSISAVSNKGFYGGLLIDSLKQDALRSLDKITARSPFGQNPLVLYDLSDANPWSSRLEQRGGRYNLYSAILAAELANQAVKAGIENLGVISPYSIHARLIKMLLDDSNDLRLHRVKAATVHKFQGLEEDIVIFDIAEGPMPRLGPSPLVSGDLGSQAAKLINVSITRPKAQLVLLANLRYLKSKLSRNSILLNILQDFQQDGIVRDSRTVVNDFVCSEYDRWASLLNPRTDHIDPDSGNLYTDRNFYAAFFNDLRHSSREIIIVSPFLTATRSQNFMDLFSSKLASGVEVRVFTRPLREQQGDMYRQSDLVVESLKNLGVQVIERRGLHQKFAFIDRSISWEGSLNILSQSEGRSEEHMRRVVSTKTCEELISLHDFGSDAEVKPGSRHKIQTDRKCKRHGVAMVLVRGPHGFFLGCPAFPNCSERMAIRRGDQVHTDVRCPGSEGASCNQMMVAVNGKFGVYLKCPDPGCSGKRSISR